MERAINRKLFLLGAFGASALLALSTFGTISGPVFNEVGAATETWSHTLAKSEFAETLGETTLNGKKWTVAGTLESGEEAYLGTSSAKGVQFGKGDNGYSALSFTLPASELNSNITSVTVNTSGSNNIAATLAVTVAGNSIGSTYTLTNTAADATFTPTAAVAGDLVLSWTQTSNIAMYIKSISVSYEIPDVAVTGIAFDKTTLSLNAGDTATLNVTFTPSDATNKNLTWNTSSSAVATVSDGVVTAVGGGTATITATSESGNHTATCEVTVSSKVLTALSLNVTNFKTSYLSTETAWDDSGIVVTGTYLINGTSNLDEVITDHSEITWSFGGHTAPTAGEISITASIGNISSPAVTATVEVLSAVEETLTNSTTGASGNTYSAWTYTGSTSGITYTGNNAGSNDSIQFRSTTSSGSTLHSGIVISASTSDLVLAKIELTWNSSTDAERQIYVYGSHGPYTEVNDLFGDAKGSELGSLSYSATPNSLSLEEANQYRYIGIRSHDGSIYLTSIKLSYVHADSALTYANNFLTDTGSICKTDGSTDVAALKNAWESLSTSYNALSDHDKAIVAGAGSEESSAFGNAVARYDHIIKVHGLDDFMGRSATTTSSLHLNVTQEPSAVGAVAASLAGLTVIVVAAYLVIRKKKEAVDAE